MDETQFDLARLQNPSVSAPFSMSQDPIAPFPAFDAFQPRTLPLHPDELLDPSAFEQHSDGQTGSEPVTRAFSASPPHSRSPAQAAQFAQWATSLMDPAAPISAPASMFGQSAPFAPTAQPQPFSPPRTTTAPLEYSFPPADRTPRYLNIPRSTH